MEGASEWRVFMSIVLPNCKGPLIALFLLQFTWIWNDLLFSTVLGNTPGDPLDHERAAGVPGRLRLRRPEHLADRSANGIDPDRSPVLSPSPPFHGRIGRFHMRHAGPTTIEEAEAPTVFRPITAGPARSGVATTQRVFARLLQRILTFDLKPFDEISEGGLAEQMGVSRTPVREALARLAKLQLVDIFPQRGTVIAPLRVSDLKRSQFLRESLELGLLRRALRSPERARLAEALTAEIAVQRTLAGIGDEERFYASDELFHRHIASIAGLPDIWDDISDAKLHMDRFRHLMLASVETLSVIVEQHERIVSAIEKGDRELAEMALKTHLRRIFAFLRPAYEVRPEYFDKGGLELIDPAWFDD